MHFVDLRMHVLPQNLTLLPEEVKATGSIGVTF